VHPFADLSAYIDEALDPQSRERVDAHLATCAVCRTRVAELRATARLIAALPTPAPARSLVPRVSVPFWLAPLRTASAVASGLALVVFVLSLGSGVAQRTGAPAAAQNDRSATAASGQPALAPAAPAPQASPGAFSVAGSTTPNPAERTTVDTQTQKAVGPAGATPTPASGQQSTTGPQAVALHAPNPESGQSPVVWLALAIAFAVVAIFATWRLRAA
jgi:anti-sigma factor RsiW